MEFVQTADAPQAIGPYSQAVVHGEMVFTSGQVALRPDGSFNDGDISEQARQVLANLKAVLEAAGSAPEKVLKTTIFLADMDDFVTVNGIYEAFFGSHKPARSTVTVKTLPKNVRIEIECIAVR